MLRVCCSQALSSAQLFATPWTVACQATLSMGILQTRIREWVAMPSSRGSSQPRNQTQVSSTVSIFSTIWANREALNKKYIGFCRGSSQSRDRTHVSHIASRFLTTWSDRETREYWIEQPIPSPGDLPDPGIQPGFSELQADSLPAELSGKP